MSSALQEKSFDPAGLMAPKRPRSRKSATRKGKRALEDPDWEDTSEIPATKKAAEENGSSEGTCEHLAAYPA